VNDKPVADPQTVSVAEDGNVSITLSGSDVETPAAQLVFTITRLPQHGVLTRNGVPVAAGDTFTGPPTLRFEPGLCAEPGADSFGFTVTDTGDPAGTPGNVLTSDEAEVTLNVTPAVADGSLSFSNGVLRVGGTGGADLIVVARVGSNLLVTGSVNGRFPAAQVTDVRIWGRGGSDVIVVAADVPAFVSAGAGNDVVTGGGGAGLILGGDGDDTLVGGPGDDLLVGGRGSDRLVGASGDDVLIGGELACRFTLPAARALRAAWSATGLPVAGLRLTGPNPDVIDTEADHLTGASGSDWFVVSSGDKYPDAKPGKKGDAVSVLA
jgi:Ca2+-binding RTX toxin-like protein